MGFLHFDPVTLTSARYNSGTIGCEREMMYFLEENFLDILMARRLSQNRFVRWLFTDNNTGVSGWGVAGEHEGRKAGGRA